MTKFNIRGIDYKSNEKSESKIPEIEKDSNFKIKHNKSINDKDYKN